MPVKTVQVKVMHELYAVAVWPSIWGVPLSNIHQPINFIW